MVKSTIKRVLARVDVGVYRLSRNQAADDFDIAFLPEVGTVFDIGVAHGTPWLYDRFPTARLVLVDPVEKQRAVASLLAERPHEFVQCAVGAESGDAEVHVNLDQTGRTSLLERTALTRTDDRYETRTVPVETLDGLADRFVPADESFGVKIDTEGFELEVLRGGARSLQRAAFVICEASVQERFEDSYRFEDLVCHMRDQGFGVRAVLSAERDNQGLIRFVDVVFTPRPDDSAR